MNRLLKIIAFWTVVILSVLFVYKLLQPPSTEPNLMNSHQLTEALRAGRIARFALPRDATIGGDLTERGPDGKAAHFLIATPAYRDLVDDLIQNNVTVEFFSPHESTLRTTILSWIPMVVLIGIWIYFMRMIQAGRRKAESRAGSPIEP